MPKFTIYSLSNENGIFYIGRTTLTLQLRLQSHFHKSPFINIDYLDDCDNINDAKNLETFWIHLIKTWGFNLENRIQLIKNSKHHISKHRSIKLSPDEYEYINQRYSSGDIYELASIANSNYSTVYRRLKMTGRMRIKLYMAVCKYYNIPTQLISVNFIQIK